MTQVRLARMLGRGMLRNNMAESAFDRLEGRGVSMNCIQLYCRSGINTGGVFGENHFETLTMRWKGIFHGRE